MAVARSEGSGKVKEDWSSRQKGGDLYLEYRTVQHMRLQSWVMGRTKQAALLNG